MKFLEPIMWVGLGGLIVWGYGQAIDTKQARAAQASVTSEQRVQQAQALVKAGPTTSATKTPEGDVIEIGIPSLLLGRFAQIKRCVVWRDAQTKTTAMACEQEPSMQLPDGQPQ